MGLKFLPDGPDGWQTIKEAYPTTRKNGEEHMRWNPGGVSGNVEDRRGSSGGGGFGGGGGLRLGLGGFLLLAVLSLIFKTNFFSLLGGGGGAASLSQPSATPARPLNDPNEQREVQFVSFVLDDAQNTWHQVLPKYGAQYRDAKLVLFRDAINSGCGFAQSATGPFYCPADQKVYIDLGFYDELKQRFGASGDFAQAYVLTHEIGHHVQNLLGIDQQGAGDAAGASRHGQPTLGPAGVAGRLPGRRLGPLHRPAQHSGSRRRGQSADRGFGHRR